MKIQSTLTTICYFEFNPGFFDSLLALAFIIVILSLCFAGVVHENPKIGSDGESEEGSRTSEDVVSPANRGSAAAAGGIGGMTNGQVKMRHKPPSGVSSGLATNSIFFCCSF